MSWEDLSVNPQAITSLFDSSPSLVDVRLTGIGFYRDGPRITLAIELSDFPVRVPDRWRRDGVNSVSLGLDLIGIHSVSIAGWGVHNVVTLSVERLPERLLKVTGRGDECVFEATCHSLYIATVQGYRDERFGPRS